MIEDIPRRPLFQRDNAEGDGVIPEGTDEYDFFRCLYSSDAKKCLNDSFTPAEIIDLAFSFVHATTNDDSVARAEIIRPPGHGNKETLLDHFAFFSANFANGQEWELPLIFFLHGLGIPLRTIQENFSERTFQEDSKERLNGASLTLNWGKVFPESGADTAHKMYS